MDFVPPYPRAVSAHKVIDNLISGLGDDGYQSGAHAWAKEGAAAEEILDNYVLITESAMWREDGETPALFIFDAAARNLQDNGQGIAGVLRLVFLMRLSVPDSEGATEALRNEAYMRTLALDAMLRGLPNTELFKDTNIQGRGKLFVTERDYGGGSFLKGGSYFRYPSVTAEVRMMEGA